MFKKITLLVLTVMAALSFFACSDDITDPVEDTFTEFMLQTDWSGGQEQVDIVDSAKFNSHVGIDFSSVTGQISLSGDYNGILDGAAYNGKLYYSVAGYGTFEYDASNDKWKLLYAGHWWYYSCVFEGKLYTVSNGPARIKVYDGTVNDYGFGPNGWSEISNEGLPLYGEDDPYFNVFNITGVDGDLYINGGMWDSTAYGGGGSVGARVYKFENGSWVQVGQQVEASSYDMISYNNELYLGTHWGGRIYKLVGSQWTNMGINSGMSITSMEVFNDKLYIGSLTSSYENGYVDQFDGTTWTRIFSGAGVTEMIVHNNKLIWGTNPNGMIYQYDEDSGMSLLYDLDVSSISGLVSFNGGLYSGSGYNSNESIRDGFIYVNGLKNTKLQCCYLISSGFSSPEIDVWGNLVWNSDEPEGTGIEFWVEGKEPGEVWGASFGDQWSKVGFDKPLGLDGSDMRYKVYLWSTVNEVTPTLYDVSFKVKD